MHVCVCVTYDVSNMSDPGATVLHSVQGWAASDNKLTANGKAYQALHCLAFIKRPTLTVENSLENVGNTSSYRNASSGKVIVNNIC